MQHNNGRGERETSAQRQLPTDPSIPVTCLETGLIQVIDFSQGTDVGGKEMAQFGQDDAVPQTLLQVSRGGQGLS